MKNRMYFKRKPKNGNRPEEDLLNLAKGGIAVADEEDTGDAAPDGWAIPPKAPEAEAKAPAQAETHQDTAAEGDDDAKAAPASPAMTLTDLIRSVPGLTDENRKKLLGEAEKIESSEARSAQAKAMVEFNKELEANLPTFIEELRKKHGVNLEGRRVTIYFPKEGEDKNPKLTSSAKGNSGAGNHGGFPGKWGEAVVIGVDGKETRHPSPSKAAENLGLQVIGHRNMVDVFENPTKSGTKEELPKIYTVDAVKGSHFRISIIK